MLTLFLVIAGNSKPSYARSLFGHPGTDEVENEWVDGIEILQRGLPIPNRNHIKNAHYTATIADDDYSTPDHAITNETYQIYSSTDLYSTYFACICTSWRIGCCRNTRISCRYDYNYSQQAIHDI